MGEKTREAMENKKNCDKRRKGGGWGGGQKKDGGKGRTVKREGR